MKTDRDFEKLYAATLAECLALIEKECQHEKEQISLAIRIGKEVDLLVGHLEDTEAVFTRLSRDIFRARGKSVSPSRIAEYRQLYLKFESMDAVADMETSLINDLTVGTLTGIASKQEGQGSKPKEHASPQLIILRKASRLLDKFETTLDDKRPDDSDMAGILEELKLISGKIEVILNGMQNAGGKSQLDLFKRCN